MFLRFHFISFIGLLALNLCFITLVVDLGFIVYIGSYHSLPLSDIMPLHVYFKKFTIVHFKFPLLSLGVIDVFLIFITLYVEHVFSLLVFKIFSISF